jgi:hypothetical protein
MSIDYELATELKSAGFSQSGTYFGYYRATHHQDARVFLSSKEAQEDMVESDTFARVPNSVSFTRIVDAPTLEELMDAINWAETFVISRNHPRTHQKEWTAFVNGHVSGEYFSTPAEAAARLWLALNLKVCPSGPAEMQSQA